jgi:hypothetical protein
MCCQARIIPLVHAVYLLLVAAAGHAYSMPMASPSRSMYYAMQVPVAPLMPRSILLGLVGGLRGVGALALGLAVTIDSRRHLNSFRCACPLDQVPQANPTLFKSDQGFLEEFEAAPWLLPPRTPLLPYAGTHDFDGLLKLRSRPAGSQTKTITILLFNKAYGIMAQNSSEFGASQLDFASSCACWPPARIALTS